MLVLAGQRKWLIERPILRPIGVLLFLEQASGRSPRVSRSFKLEGACAPMLNGRWERPAD
jgi:hypothetical protein